MVPAGVVMASALGSGMEWATVTNSTLNGPASKEPPSGTVFTGTWRAPLSPAILASRSPAVKAVAYTGALQPAPQFGQRAEMILVRMSQHDRLQRLALFLDERDVRHDNVDARHARGIAEADAAIDHQPAPPCGGPYPYKARFMPISPSPPSGTNTSSSAIVVFTCALGKENIAGRNRFDFSVRHFQFEPPVPVDPQERP